MKHREGMSSFRVRQDRNQKEKKDLFEFVLNVDTKIARSFPTEKIKHSRS